jgi:hypothetical protein
MAAFSDVKRPAFQAERRALALRALAGLQRAELELAAAKLVEALLSVRHIGNQGLLVS